MYRQATRVELSTWLKLNDVLRNADEELCLQLLKAERQGRKRSQFLRRIHSRLNRVRRVREREELTK